MPEKQINLNPAEAAADLAQQKVNACIDAGKNFRLEAGAGAGKTYSLVEALKRLIAERGAEYIQKRQQVACITFTKVARDEILNEIDQHPAILVETIHSFCWGFMSRFQSHLRTLIPQFERYKEKVEEAGGLGAKTVEYNLGFFGIEEDKVTLYHDDVPEMMAKLMELPKFRQLLTSAYPVLFIDEYQDTDAAFMGSISQHFFLGGEGPLVGLFGDHWQTIYRDDFDLAALPNVEGIDKGANFRSTPAVVKVLNQLRPELIQAVKDPDAIGEAQAFHTNGYVGERTNDRNSKDDVLAPIARGFLAALRKRLVEEGWDFNPKITKILMLTHNALAEEQGYPTVVDIFKGRSDAFAKKEDKTIDFLVSLVEPMCKAYQEKRYGEMFRVLGRPQAIKSHADKQAWRKDMEALEILRKNSTVGELLDHLKKTQRPRLADPVTRREEAMIAFNPESGEEEPNTTQRHRRLRDVPYTEIVELAKFIEGFTPFATQHSVKGAEFENVLVVLGGGWNHYNWPRMLGLMSANAIPEKQKKGFYRARNLFYVGISRPKKRLAVLLTQTLPDDAMTSLEKLFGAQHTHVLNL
jgi:DNA helicase-2/ATP-dependent DNA helicase PcrA